MNTCFIFVFMSSTYDIGCPSFHPSSPLSVCANLDPIVTAIKAEDDKPWGKLRGGDMVLIEGTNLGPLEGSYTPNVTVDGEPCINVTTCAVRNLTSRSFVQVDDSDCQGMQGKLGCFTTNFNCGAITHLKMHRRACWQGEKIKW